MEDFVFYVSPGMMNVPNHTPLHCVERVCLPTEISTDFLLQLDRLKNKLSVLIFHRNNEFYSNDNRVVAILGNFIRLSESEIVSLDGSYTATALRILTHSPRAFI